MTPLGYPNVGVIPGLSDQDIGEGKSRQFTSTTAASSPKRPRKFITDGYLGATPRGIGTNGPANLSFSRGNSHLTDESQIMAR
jgi:hypothetical protein